MSRAEDHNGIPLAPFEDPFDVALPMFYASPRSHAQYRKLIELGARAGDPLAEYAMATWYLFGNAEIGVKRSPARAVALLSRAASTLNRAMYDLAICKLHGQGTKQDERGGYRLLARASQLGCLPAMKAQAQCLKQGIGVKVDRATAALLDKRANYLMRAQQRILNRRS
jgi:TPR repeat protein